MKLALAIITYDRAHYLSMVLPSILAQTIDGRPIHEHFDIYIFQDGFCHSDSRSVVEGHQRVAEIMQRLPEYVSTFHQDENLGVALHFDFVEKLLFREKSYDFVLFCEDDLVLSPQYASIVKKMAKKFAGDKRVGMISAHPANPLVPIADQAKNIHEYAEMGHNWGFGVFRDFWEKRQTFVELYLNFVRNIPYRSRPHKLIFDWLQSCGFNPSASSQDFVKQCATAALGAVRFSTYANFGLPIGRTGLHSKPELFSKLGFDRTIVCDQPLYVPSDLSERQFHEILHAQKTACLIKPDEFPSPVQWENRVLSGTLNPQVLPTAAEPDRTPHVSANVITWSSKDIPALPHMEAEGLELLTGHLKKSSCFLEYGAGGSTILAATMGVENIYSVESDRSFLDAVRGAVKDASQEVSLIDHYVDIGPTVEWGNPKDSSKAANWPLYASSIWNRILAEGSAQPDLVLIDGRFRVACFLATLLFARPGTIILFDDYHDRPHYHVVEKHLKPVGRSGRMAKFETKGAAHPEAMIDLMAHSTIFA